MCNTAAVRLRWLSVLAVGQTRAPVSRRFVIVAAIVGGGGRRFVGASPQVCAKRRDGADQEKTLKLATSRVMGNEHRSVFHFKGPPDATPRIRSSGYAYLRS